MSIFKTDILVLGSGVAGLSIAIKTAATLPEKTILVATKAHESESNTKYAQGGIAAVWDKLDTFEDHIKDTMVAGDYLSDPKVVKMVVEEAPDCMRQLISWGTDFDQNVAGEIDLGKEGGHSTNRILHYKDVTGYELEKTLLEQVDNLPNIQLLPYHFAIDLITDHHLTEKTDKDEISCYGAYILNQKTNKIDTYLATSVVLATGGIGQVYAATTNPVIATGDGIAMAYRAKARITDMEFVQFHPTSLYQPGESPSFLISEAVRGFGAYLRNKAGERFMLKIDERGELAPRDIVSRAINTELIFTGDPHVFLDCTHLDMSEFIKHFPNIYEKCKSLGIDPGSQFIPVVPAAHYLMGGIEVDMNGYSSVINLFACGECSRTGLHGANRLASNSLLEALVFGNKIAEEIIHKRSHLKLDSIPEIPEWDEEGTMVPKENVLISHNRKTIQNIMSDLVAIVRSNERLEKAMDHLNYLYQDTEKAYEKSKLSPQICELRNLNAIAYLIVNQSMHRKENKGAFFSLDNIDVKP
ncbi:L-aspartate oxidase [Lutimonas sp.]|uniref:L-aspartate oxidase n=1 Tax=Lutimonas sp. TaxID=1872403 RepID=UPI003C729007